MFGFECFNRNGLEQLIINTLNEQMQYHYNQRIFISEMLEMEAEDIDTINLNFYDNKTALDNLLTKPDGLFYIIDDASRSCQDQDLIMGKLSRRYLSNYTHFHDFLFSVRSRVGKAQPVREEAHCHGAICGPLHGSHHLRYARLHRHQSRLCAARDDRNVPLLAGREHHAHVYQSTDQGRQSHHAL